VSHVNFPDLLEAFFNFYVDSSGLSYLVLRKECVSLVDEAGYFFAQVLQLVHHVLNVLCFFEIFCNDCFSFLDLELSQFRQCGWIETNLIFEAKTTDIMGGRLLHQRICSYWLVK